MARGNFGERLKRERELREVAPNEIVVATRISLRFLEALENEDWDKLPGGVFNRGFVRAIARYLGLDEENLLAEYDLAHGDESAEAPRPLENRIPSPPKWIGVAIVVGALALIAVLAAGGVYGWRRHSESRRAKASQAITTQSTGTAQLTTPQRGDPLLANPPMLDLAVSTSLPTRVRVIADGKVVLDAEIPAGENRHFAAETAFEISADDPNAVLLELNGQPMPSIASRGASGTIVLSQRDLRPVPGGNSQP